MGPPKKKGHVGREEDAPDEGELKARHFERGNQLPMAPMYPLGKEYGDEDDVQPFLMNKSTIKTVTDPRLIPKSKLAEQRHKAPDIPDEEGLSHSSGGSDEDDSSSSDSDSDSQTARTSSSKRAKSKTGGAKGSTRESSSTSYEKAEKAEIDRQIQLRQGEVKKMKPKKTDRVDVPDIDDPRRKVSGSKKDSRKRETAKFRGSGMGDKKSRTTQIGRLSREDEADLILAEYSPQPWENLLREVTQYVKGDKFFPFDRQRCSDYLWVCYGKRRTGKSTLYKNTAPWTYMMYPYVYVHFPFSLFFSHDTLVQLGCMATGFYGCNGCSWFKHIGQVCLGGPLVPCPQDPLDHNGGKFT